MLLLLLGAGLIAVFQTFGWGGGNPPTRYEKILHNVGDMLKEIHYSPKKFDDNFSKELFKKFLTDRYVDENKNILLQSDIQNLRKFETKLDDEIMGGTVLFVPAVSEAHSQGKRQLLYRRTAGGFRLANIVTVPAFVGVWILAEPLSIMLYHAPQAAPAVRALSFSIVLLGVHQVSTGVLQGMGRTFIPVGNMTVSAAAKVALNWVLTAVPALGIIGAAWATVADIGIAALLNIYYVRRLTGFALDGRALAKSVLSAAVMGGAVFVTHRFILAASHSNNLATFLAIGAGVVVYSLCMLCCGGIGERDIGMVPLIGAPLRIVLKRLRLLRTVDD